MWDIFKKIFKRSQNAFKVQPVYSVDDEGFHELKADGTETDITWTELESVDIITTSDGPYFDDLFYVIRAKDRGIIIDQFKAQNLKLLDQFQRLPGFNWEAVLLAACSITEKSFACWDNSLGQPTALVK